MPIYWGTIGGPSSIPLFLIGMAVYMMLMGTYEFLNEFSCPPPPDCINCADGVTGVYDGINQYNGTCQMGN